MPEKFRAEHHVDAVGGVREQIGAQSTEHHFEQIDTTISPKASTSSVVRPLCTSTLSMTTWKNNGVISANSCRKNEAISTSRTACDI